MTSIPHKPPVTMIDFKVNPKTGAVIVLKYDDGWTAMSMPVERSVQYDKSLDEMLSWLDEKGWTIYRWPHCPELEIWQGATAYRGRPMPKRNRHQIIDMRRRLNDRAERIYSQPDANRGELAIQVHSIDLAYML